MGRNRNYGGGGALPPQNEEAMLQLTRTLTPAQVKTLFSVGYQMAPAPGNNRWYVPFALTYRLVYGTTPYAAGGDIFVGPGALADDEGLGKIVAAAWHANADSVGYAMMNSPPEDDDITAKIANQPLLLYAHTADFTLGDSPIIVTVFYGIGIGD